MNESMVERVKVAIAGELAANNDWDKAAHAAIEAMLDPTEEMLVAGVAEEVALEKLAIAAWARWREDFLIQKWQAMIKAALDKPA